MTQEITGWKRTRWKWSRLHQKSMETSWWFPPIWKDISPIGSFPQIGMTYKIFETHHLVMVFEGDFNIIFVSPPNFLGPEHPNWIKWLKKQNKKQLEISPPPTNLPQKLWGTSIQPLHFNPRSKAIPRSKATTWWCKGHGQWLDVPVSQGPAELWHRYCSTNSSNMAVLCYATLK